LKATEKAANASTDSARAAFQSTEMARDANRPYLLVTEARGQLNENYGSAGNHSLQAFVAVQNFGQSPADVEGYTASWGIFDSPVDGRTDPIMSHAPEEYSVLSDAVVGVGQQRNPYITVSATIPPDQLGNIKSDRKRVGIHGRIKYRGTTDRDYETRFFWWYFQDGGLHRWCRANTKVLNSRT